MGRFSEWLRRIFATRRTEEQDTKFAEMVFDLMQVIHHIGYRRFGLFGIKEVGRDEDRTMDLPYLTRLYLFSFRERYFIPAGLGLALSRDVTGRHVQERRLPAAPRELEQVEGAVHVDGERVAEIGIELGEPGAAHLQNHVIFILRFLKYSLLHQLVKSFCKLLL